MKQIIKHAVAKVVGKNIHMQPVALEMPRKMLSDMVWPGGQKISKFFNTIAENFYPTIKIFGGTIFFLTAHMKLLHYTIHTSI